MTEVTFFTHMEELKLALPPKPAREFWPEWFKKQSASKSGTVKTCPGILDVLSYGYIIPLWLEFMVKRGPGSDDIDWRIPDNINHTFGPNPQGSVNIHPRPQIEHYPFSQDTFHGSFKLINPWQIRTPRGYSCYICEPQYNAHPNLKIVSGIIDTDVYHEAHINTWFTAPSGEEKLLPLGMPIAQVIPFKREEFEMKAEFADKRSTTSIVTRFLHNSMFAKQKSTHSGLIPSYRSKLNTHRYK